MRVLVGTDGSSSAGLAVDLAAGLAWPDGSTIHIVHAIDLGPALFAGPWPTVALTQIDDIERRLEGYAREELDAARERSTKPGVQVRTTILRGRAATAIVEAAGADRADLIIVGSRGHGAIESMLLGSVSEEVVDQAAMSVLIARRATASRVVLAWDGSPGGRAAADAVRTWPIFAGAAVRVVSVAESGSRWWTGVPVDGGAMEFASVYLDAAEASRADHEELARSLARELQEQGLTADWELRQGDAAREVLAAAEAWGADLIVTGTHGRTGLARIVLGSVARNVLHHALASVLIVRAQATSS